MQSPYWVMVRRCGSTPVIGYGATYLTPRRSSTAGAIEAMNGICGSDPQTLANAGGLSIAVNLHIINRMLS
jgi:hypothetical protein